jgi:hypothetical protein
VKNIYVARDEFVVKKKWVLQVSMFLTFPFHLQMAQKLFGAAVGLNKSNSSYI